MSIPTLINCEEAISTYMQYHGQKYFCVGSMIPIQHERLVTSGK